MRVQWPALQQQAVYAMNLEELLSPERTLVKHQVESKKQALAQLSETLSTSINHDDSDELYEGFIMRERLGSTAIGHGIAIPHIRSPHASKPIAALMTLAKPIEFEAIDELPVDILFALVVPQQATEQHLQILAHLAGLFQQANVRTQCRQAQTASQLYNTLVTYHDQPALTD